MPNPESALNEEAGKLLLEDYDAYASQAKLWTSIHANPKNQLKSASLPAVDADQTGAAPSAEAASIESSPKKQKPEAKKRSIRRL